MVSIERKQRLRDDIVRLLTDLNFAMEDARAHEIPWTIETGDGVYIYLNTAKDRETARAAASPKEE